MAHICKHNKQFLNTTIYSWNTTNTFPSTTTNAVYVPKYNTIFAKHNTFFPKHKTIFAKHKTKFSDYVMQAFVNI